MMFNESNWPVLGENFKPEGLRNPQGKPEGKKPDGKKPDEESNDEDKEKGKKPKRKIPKVDGVPFAESCLMLANEFGDQVITNVTPVRRGLNSQGFGKNDYFVSPSGEMSIYMYHSAAMIEFESGQKVLVEMFPDRIETTRVYGELKGEYDQVYKYNSNEEYYSDGAGNTAVKRRITGRDLFDFITTRPNKDTEYSIDLRREYVCHDFRGEVTVWADVDPAHVMTPAMNQRVLLNLERKMNPFDY
jgi:hypothetical protein